MAVLLIVNSENKLVCIIIRRSHSLPISVSTRHQPVGIPRERPSRSSLAIKAFVVIYSLPPVGGASAKRKTGSLNKKTKQQKSNDFDGRHELAANVHAVE